MKQAQVRFGRMLLGLVLYIAAMAGSEATPERLPLPVDEVVLKVSGKITRTNVNDEAHLDLGMLRSLTRTTLVTQTPWNNSEPQEFAGVRISDLLDYVGSSSTAMIAVGLDDYHFTLKDIAFDEYPVIIAYEHNGHAMSIRQLGPLRIIFPYSDYPELNTSINEFSSVWQLVRLKLL